MWRRAFFVFAIARADWTVLPNTDWSHDCAVPYSKGTSAADCANQCVNHTNCVAVSWNSPKSKAKDNYCNFKVSVHG